MLATTVTRQPMSEVPESLRPVIGAFAANLRRLRTDVGMSQDRLAAAAGGEITQTSISRWEKGDQVPRLVDVLLLADALGVHVQVLLEPLLGEPGSRVTNVDLRRDLLRIADQLLELPPEETDA